MPEPLATTLHTEDTFFDGRIRVKQNARGYRFSVDAVILAWHIVPAANAKIVDIGTGCGIIPLILAYRHRTVTIDALEIQPQLAALARENVISNHMEHRITLCCDDINQAVTKMAPGGTDVVLCNPPFRKTSAGRINPDQERAIARHEITMTLAEIIAAARRLLRSCGEFAAVYPAARLTDMIAEMRLASIEPKLIRMIHSREGDPAKLFVIKGSKNGRPGITIPPPLTIYHNDGVYTTEAKKMFDP